MHASIKDAENKMRKSIDAFKNELTKLRTGRANPAILDHIRVDYYGNPTPISQVANITASDARTLTITPWEKNMMQPIEKAIHTSDLGLNPTVAGSVIRVPLPALNEERRKELIKVARSEAENARVGIRNSRRDGNTVLKDLLKKKLITEDEERRLGDEMQKITDKFVAEIEQLLATKETELMSI